MIEKAINKILELAKPTLYTDDHGNTWSNKKLIRRPNELLADPIILTTLKSLVDFIKEFPNDKKAMPYLVHVVSPVQVVMMSALDTDRNREKLIEVRAEVPEFSFGRYMDNESMLIGVQSKFVDDPNTDRDIVLKFAGTVTTGSVKEYGDDGVTQKATVRQGVASKVEAIVPSPCVLRPYRTFMEVEQPASNFIFRMREGIGDTVESALFEADGGAWKLVAKSNIYNYLKDNLQDTGITVIA